MNNIPEKNENVKPEKRIDESSNLSYWNDRAYKPLEYKYLYWKDKGKLEKDGSFFLSDSDYAYLLHTTRLTAIRRKQALRALGKIRYIAKRGYRGTTHYWLTAYDKKKVLKTPEVPQERPPLDREAVRQLVKLKGKDFVLSCEAFKGYPRAEIEGCFED